MSIKEKWQKMSANPKLKWVGVGAFLFFLIKGLLWIAVAVGIWLGVTK